MPLIIALGGVVERGTKRTVPFVPLGFPGLFQFSDVVNALTDFGFDEAEITVGDYVLGSELGTQTYAGNAGFEPSLKA